MRGSGLAFILIMVCPGLTGGCEHRRQKFSPLAHPRYMLGPSWQSEGYWFYPTEEMTYDATGLATVDAPRTYPQLTADGEVYDPALLTGAHQTLQLPVILRVRNLENGLQITLRVNDRGPASPGRLLSVTPHAAQLLRMVPGQATRVHLAEDESRSRTLWKQVDGAPAPDIVAVPVDAVEERSLMPGRAVGEADQAATVRQEHAEPETPERSVEPVTAGSADPTQLWIDAGRFSQSGYARRLAATLAGTVHQDGHGRSASFNVRVGPFKLTAEADAALDRARSAGVTGARIVVE